MKYIQYYQEKSKKLRLKESKIEVFIFFLKMFSPKKIFFTPKQTRFSNHRPLRLFFISQPPNFSETTLAKNQLIKYIIDK
jgi:hypothetical protein